MIVLDQNGIGEIKPVPVSSPQKDGLLLKSSEARCGLAGGGYAHSSPGRENTLPGYCGDAAHPGQEVKGEPFRLEYGSGASAYAQDPRAAGHELAIVV